MTKLDPDQIKVILATDCGSTTTKAILIQYVDGEYRQTHRGEAPTTVEKPFADVTMGVVNSVTEIAELADRRLVGDDGRTRTGGRGRTDRQDVDRRPKSTEETLKSHLKKQKIAK